MKWQNLAALMVAPQLMALENTIYPSVKKGETIFPKDKKTKHRRLKNKLARKARKR